MFDPDQKQALYEQISVMPTVDAHEHIHSEEMRTGRPVDIFLLFHQYLIMDLVGAGMDEQAADDLGSPEVALDRKWDLIAPYLDLVRTGSVAGPPFAALRKFFDAEDLTKDNYVELSQKMQAHNKPGVYEKVMREACNIVLALNQNTTMWQTDIFKPILFEDKFIGSGSGESLRSAMAEDGQEPAADLEGYVRQMDGLLRKRKAEGMIGVKGYCRAYVPVDATTAALAYPRVLSGTAAGDDCNAVLCHLRSRMYDIMGEINLVGVLHSGIWAGNWYTIETIRPTYVYEIACAHRNTRFDLFHAASPSPADAGFITRSLPNVYLNSCWSHLLSPTLTKQAWDMWLDMFPFNRVMAWGGDYWWAIENVYGAVDAVRQALAEVLAGRIAAGSFNEARALQIARRWMHDNAKEIYWLD
jgi:uncharacterized protein